MKANVRKKREAVYEPTELRISEYSIGGGLPPSQLHVIIGIQNAKVIARLKSRAVVTEFIEALTKHRDQVWREDGRLVGPIDQIHAADDLPAEVEAGDDDDE